MSADKMRRTLVQSFLPSVPGLVARLEAGGARVLDIGCGHGVALLVMAKVGLLASVA